jgi:hypothetical protein
VLTVLSARRAVGALKGAIRSGGRSVVADIARTCLPAAAWGGGPVSSLAENDTGMAADVRNTLDASTLLRRHAERA